MPEITEELRKWSVSGGPTTATERFAIDTFIFDAIREHQEGAKAVDAEYLINHPLHGENKIDNEWSLDITSSGVSLHPMSDGSYYDVDRELPLPVKTVKQLDALIDLFGLRIVGGGE